MPHRLDCAFERVVPNTHDAGPALSRFDYWSWAEICWFVIPVDRDGNGKPVTRAQRWG